MDPGSSRASLALLCLLLLLTHAPPASAQEGAAALRVVVRSASTDRPLAGAQVVVRGVGIQGATDQAGVVHLRGLTPGSRVVSVQFLGFAPAHSTVVLPMEGTVEVAFELTPRPVQLAAVQVRAARPSYLYTNGFHERRLAGFGTFLTREEISRRQPRYLSDVLRSVAGLNLTPTVAGQTSISIRGPKTTRCPVQYYVDGILVMAFEADEMNVNDVEGVEIYRGASTLPPQFNRGSAMCGVIAIWTRHR